jgi:hypothetical protein
MVEDACREADLIEAMRGELGTQQLTAIGSTGQVVVHPIVQEIRQYRAIIACLLGYLKLPDEDDPGERSSSARASAMARWSRDPR